MTAHLVDGEVLPERTLREMQRLLDQVEQRRHAIAASAHADPPSPGWVREQPTGRERPATGAELRECERLLAKHRDLARPQAHKAPAT